MEVDTTPAGAPIIDREKTVPFLIRTFVKIGSFHRLTFFEDGTLPTTDEQQLFTWKDATLREVVSTLRNTAPHVPEYRHPLARFSFRTVYADSSTKGRFSQKDLGIVYSRDILGEPGALGTTAPRLLEDTDDAPRAPADPEKAERTLDELRFVPGDYLLVAVLFPQRVNLGTELNIKGSATAAPASNGWKAAAEKGTGRGGVRHPLDATHLLIVVAGMLAGVVVVAGATEDLVLRLREDVDHDTIDVCIFD
ncbi:Sin3 associated polypeptide p18-domain-containing protein [Schizophyllum amplum]|uniref:Sin3 associated polypeptide p18-domain-containing protein n=1 Tax=Schizophyllum amplum TaxID=97359 RepID=A0A550CRL7_9AGAR|nr:Sin3 associated polypeptide p18-domain-containing protein [Auriculariopsis ampla]